MTAQNDERLADVIAQWNLVEIGAPFDSLSPNLVVPVRDGVGASFVLKLVPNPESAHAEAAALRYWDGRGAITLHAFNPERGALLLERALPGHGLDLMCATDDRGATATAGSVINELRSARSPLPPEVPTLASWLAALQSTTQRSDVRPAAERACALARELQHDNDRVILLHGDLHHYNILNAERSPWLAIDPKGVLGPPEAEAAALLRNPRDFVLAHSNPRALLADRVALLTECTGDDPKKLIGWGYALAVLAAVWSVEDEESRDETARWLECADMLARVGPS